MAAKMGRPTDNPKNTSFNIRIDMKCESILERYTSQESVSRAEAVRRGILKLEADIKE